MKMQRGILVDAKGNFIGAFQWDASKPRPNFNLPRRGQRRVLPEDRKTLLPESVAVRGMEFMRWNFQTQTWDTPSKKGWLVDERGNMRGSRRFFPDQPPSIPIGWQLTEVQPPRERNRRPYFHAGDWKFANRAARVENGTIVNIELVRDDAELDAALIPVPLREDGTTARKGDVQKANGNWGPPNG